MKEDFSVYNGEGTVLRKAQLKMLDILTVIDEICQKHNIPYWIDYGTLLGAVRHKGFIPWDDDLDISVLYSDYARFKKVLSAELPADLAFQDWISEPKIAFKGAKIRDKNSYYNDGNTKRGEMEFQGVFVDVFPIDKVPSKNFRKNINYFYGRSFRRIRGFKSTFVDLILGYLIWPFALIAEQFSRFVAWMIKSKKMGNIYGGLNFPCTHLIGNIFPLVKIQFEGRSFYAPNNAHAHLTEIYNNYMWIPPANKREVHASEIIFFDEIQSK